MVLVDTSAWIEYFRNGKKNVAEDVDYCLENDQVAVGDLIYCEVMQGLKNTRERNTVSTLLRSLPGFEMLGFEMADKSAANYRLLRSKGVTVRKSIDVMIGTFCIEHNLELIHNDRDFNGIAKVLPLKIFH